jgi:vacuolar-type H+-ATPase subunit F/Vma7
MARVAVIGEEMRVQGFGLVGAVVCPATGADAVRAAWQTLADDIAVVLLTPTAASALADLSTGTRLTVVMPQ